MHFIWNYSPSAKTSGAPMAFECGRNYANLRQITRYDFVLEQRSILLEEMFMSETETAFTGGRPIRIFLPNSPIFSIAKFRPTRLLYLFWSLSICLAIFYQLKSIHGVVLE